MMRCPKCKGKGIIYNPNYWDKYIEWIFPYSHSHKIVCDFCNGRGWIEKPIKIEDKTFDWFRPR